MLWKSSETALNCCEIAPEIPKTALKLLGNSPELTFTLLWSCPILKFECSDRLKLELLGNSSESALKLPLSCPILKFECSDRLKLELLGNSSGSALKLLWICPIQQCQCSEWDFSETVGKLAMNCSGTALELLWSCSGIALLTERNCTRSSAPNRGGGSE